jgi:thioredoxin
MLRVSEWCSPSFGMKAPEMPGKRAEFSCLIAAAAVLVVCGCGVQQEKKAIRSVHSYEQFLRIIESSGPRLLAFDLYADWCAPCRMLTPQLEQIAKAYKGKVDFYKVNVDHNPKTAQAFGVSGIPYVVFIKGKKAVDALVGIHAPEAYIDIINRYGE